MKLMRKRKKMEKKYVVLSIIVSICLVIGIVSLTVREDRQLSFVEKGLKDAGVWTLKILYTPFRFITDKIDNYKDMKRIYQLYKNVDNVESKALLLEEENKELKSSLNELKTTLKLHTLISDYETINATIIHRDVGNWYHTMTLDKGEKQGIKVGMIVINNDGLIGQIIKTSFYTSDVKLISTPDLNSKISVSINADNNPTYGILSGYDKVNKQLLVIDIIDNTPIKVGDKVTTSGLSDWHPKGIIVGSVAKIETDDFGISKRIRVIPASDFNNLRYVIILKGHDSL